jgi:hypothetical protein
LKAKIKTFIEAEDNVLSDDLLTALHAANSDEDLDFVIREIRKYAKNSDSSFNFEVPLMKLFYVTNKTDLALEFFMSEVTFFLLFKVIAYFYRKYLLKKKEHKYFQTGKVAVILMNKLYEEKRYEDIVRVFDKLQLLSTKTKVEGSVVNIEHILDAFVELVIKKITSCLN